MSQLETSLLTPKQRAQARVGEEWAEFLKLRRSRTHNDRYDICGGEKTALGVYRTLKRLINEEGAKTSGSLL